MVSVRTSGWRTLHQVGSCWRRPGIDYRVESAHGDVLPDPGRYNAVCKSCFIKPTAKQLVADVDDTASDETSAEDGGI